MDGSGTDACLCWGGEECNLLFCQQTPGCTVGVRQWSVKCAQHGTNGTMFIENICPVFTNLVTIRVSSKLRKKVLKINAKMQ